MQITRHTLDRSLVSEGRALNCQFNEGLAASEKDRKVVN
jgi:hypothetical protein